MEATGSNPRRWKRIASVLAVATALLAVNSLGLVQAAVSEATSMETRQQVRYDVHDYRTGETYTLRYSVSGSAYQEGQAGALTKLRVAAGNDEAYADLVQPEAPLVQLMAEDLHEISGGDEELYTNMALQIAHQMYYSLTPQAKSAVATLVEGSGDCDPQAVAAASLIAAADRRFADFDADVVLFLYWPHRESPNEEVQWGHMQIGVHTGEDLDDVRRDKTDQPSGYEHRGRTYHVGEPTFERGFNPNWKEGWRLGENWYPRQPDVVIPV